MAKEQLISLLGDIEFDEGTVAVSSRFRELDSLAKADLLKDWIETLEAAYEEARRDL